MTVRELEKRLEKEPDNLPLRVTLAGQLRDAGRIAEAVELYRSVAVAYRAQGRVQQAIAVCRSILELAPDDAACNALLVELVKRDPTEPPPAPEMITATGSQVEPTRRPKWIEPAELPRPATKTAPTSSASMDSTTPLPKPVPYHVHEPTSSVEMLPRTDVDLPSVEGAETRPGDEEPVRGADTTGLAQAARRISGLIAGEQLPLSRGSVVRLTASEDPVTNERPAIARPVAADFDDAPTPPPGRTASRDTDEDLTQPRELLAAEPVANAFFEPLPAGKRDAALRRCHERALAAGDIAIHQGESSHPLILVISGRLEVRAERPNGTTIALEVVEPGQYIGEAALLGRTPAPASVIALEDSTVLTLAPHALFELAGAYPALWAALKDAAERRTRHYERAIRASP